MNIKHPVPSAIVYLIAWILCSLLVIADVLVFREAMRDVMTAVQAQRIENAAPGEGNVERIQAGFVAEMVDRVILIVGGLSAVGLSLFFEYYFRLGRQEGVLIPRIGRVGAILIAVLLVSVIVQTLL